MEGRARPRRRRRARRRPRGAAHRGRAGLAGHPGHGPDHLGAHRPVRRTSPTSGCPTRGLGRLPRRPDGRRRAPRCSPAGRPDGRRRADPWAGPTTTATSTTTGSRAAPTARWPPPGRPGSPASSPSAPTPTRSAAAIAVAAAHDDVWATVGLHPHDASPRRRLDRGAARRRPTVVAVGECGLDYHYDHSPRDGAAGGVRRPGRAGPRARAAARDPHPRGLGRHVRRPRRRGRARAHRSSTASPAAPDEARRVPRPRRLPVVLAASSRFKTADDVRAAAALCPLDRLLVETDSPYLAPVPHRGQRNQPAFVPVVGAAVADGAGG